ncbi:MAG: glycosyltransferase [Bradymonadales bacterium]|nr:glycosyltransferase [Bradymonadales bacterium]
MKLAFVGPCYPYRGGIAHYNSSLALAARECGHEVRLYNFTRQYPGPLFPGATQLDPSPPGPDTPTSIRCIDSLNPLTWLLTGRRIKRFRPDLVVVQWWHPFFAPSFGTIARSVRRHRTATVLFLCHNVFPHEASAVDRLLLRYAYGQADGFVVQASVERDKIHSLLGRDAVVEVAPHPPYDRFTRQATPIDPATARQTLGLTASRILLFFGLIRPYKGLGVLLEALARVQTPDLQLVVVGECYEDKKRYRDQIDRLGIGGRVLLVTRYIPDDQVPLYFAAADVAVLPYLSATGSGIAQMAFAFGLPVIVSGVGGIPEMVKEGETGLLVPPGCPDVLARAIDRFYSERLADRLRAGIQADRRENGWRSVVEALCRCRQRCLSGP